MRSDGRSDFLKLETILKAAVSDQQIHVNMEFSSIDSHHKEQIICQVVDEYKMCVVGALYNDFEGVLYSFDLKRRGSIYHMVRYNFMLKYKVEIENLNCNTWAKFLEKVISNNVLIRLSDKFELVTSKNPICQFIGKF